MCYPTRTPTLDEASGQGCPREEREGEQGVRRTARKELGQTAVEKGLGSAWAYRQSTMPGDSPERVHETHGADDDVGDRDTTGAHCTQIARPSAPRH